MRYYKNIKNIKNIKNHLQNGNHFLRKEFSRTNQRISLQ